MSLLLTARKFIVGYPLFTNAYLVAAEGSKRALAIDPGFGAVDKLLPAARELGLSIELIVNTHGHFDHVGGNAALQKATGAKLLIHGADATMLEAAFPPLPKAVPFEASKADGFLSDKQIIGLDSLSLEVMHTPGHTPGSVCLYSREDGILFTGDLLFERSHGRTDFTGGDDALLRASLKAVAGLPPETRILSGHGAETVLEKELGWMREMF